MRKRLSAIFAAALLMISVNARVAHAQAAEAFDERAIKEAVKKMALEASKPEDFVPAGWEIYAQTASDLNGDGLIDYALDIAPQETKDFLAYDAIVVLLAERNGKLRRFAINEGLTTNGFGSKPSLAIEKGVLVVNANYGNSDATDVTFRFRYDRTTGKLTLIGFQYEQYSRPGLHDGYVTSENYLTGVRIETVKHLDTRKNTSAIYGNSTSRRSRLKRRVVTFEEAGLNILKNGLAQPY